MKIMRILQGENNMTTNKRSRIIGLLIALMMVFTMLPNTTFAATTYNLYVNGEQITSDKLEITCGSGTATYDSVTSTLTLDNATITQGKTGLEYGINALENKKLIIALKGTNRIILPDGGGIVALGDIEIVGGGTLIIQVGGETYDGITTEGNVLVKENVNLEVRALKGIGIAGSIVEIDGAKVELNALYAGIDAYGLKIINKSDVLLTATEENCNAAFIRKTEDGNEGNVYFNGSKIEAESFYPGIYAAGSLKIYGGEVLSTSTADAAMWTVGDWTVEGGAKLTLNGKYATGCNGDFVVGAADIDSKNTNDENLPAILDVPQILYGYKLTLAKAVDSDGTVIDLLSSGTQYLNLYKNVHFVTADIISSIELPFKKTVKQSGNAAPGKQVFEFEIFGIGNFNTDEYADVTVTASIETNGVGDYEGKIIIEGPVNQLEAFICEGFFIREKNTAAANWIYSDAIYRIQPDRGDDAWVFNIFPAKLIVVDDEEYYEVVQDTPVEAMTFENTYDRNDDTTPITIKLPFKKTVRQEGNTAPGKQIFEFEIFDIGNSNTNEYADVTVTAQVETNGKGDYNGEIIIAGPKYQVEAFVCEGFYICEKNTGVADWTYSDAVYCTQPYITNNDELALDIFPVELTVTDNGEYYVITQDTPVEVMLFENTYNLNRETPPETGDTENLMLWFAILLVSFVVAAGTTLYGKKRKES